MSIPVRFSVLLLCLACVIGGVPEARASELVVLLHGLARSERSMRPLEEPLREAGFEVRNLGYPSTKMTPQELVGYLEGELAGCCLAASRLHFVTHSLGGILVRAYLAQAAPDNLGRVVMLGPPNGGSELVDMLGESQVFEWALGPTATELGTGPESLPNRLPAPDFELGVIAGKRKINLVGAAVIPGESDGTVSVASTQLPGMSDFTIVASSHTFIMRSERVARLIVAFLKRGRFTPEEV